MTSPLPSGKSRQIVDSGYAIYFSISHADCSFLPKLTTSLAWWLYGLAEDFWTVVCLPSFAGYCLIFCIGLGCNDLTIIVFHLCVFVVKSQAYWVLIVLFSGSTVRDTCAAFWLLVTGISRGPLCVVLIFHVDILIKYAVMYSVPSESTSHSYQPLHLVLTNEVH